jgi:hypothetical protein
MKVPRWQHCVSHGDAEAEVFIREYFGRIDRSCLIVAGAGFDPRSAAIPTLLSEVMTGGPPDRLSAVFIREHRPNPGADLLRAGDGHAALLQRTISKSQIVNVDVLAESDGAVVGGQRIIAAMRGLGADILSGVTDVVLDMSALSIGIAFPLASYFVAACETAGPRVNFHVMTASHPFLDDAITAISSDVVDPIRGFSGEIDFEGSATEPKIWLPHLSRNRNSALQLILDSLEGPVGVCPVLLLSQRDPTAADRLIAEFENELYEGWNVDPRNLVYAIEDDPLDLYRTISAIHRRTHSVFKDVTKPHLVLSPSGNKVLAIGALMAALEHKIAVRYVESVGYEVDWKKVEAVDSTKSRLVHVWLQGEPYIEVDDVAEAPRAGERAGSPVE